MVDVEVREMEEAMVMVEMMAKVDDEGAGEGDVDRGDKGHHYHRSVRRDEGMRMWPCQTLGEDGKRWMLQ